MQGIGNQMQNHVKRRLNNTNVNVMAAIAIGAMLVFSVTGMKAFADNVQDDIQVDPAQRTITEGASTTVNYWIQATGPGGASSCDASDGSSVKITFNVPSDVTVDPSSHTFNQCGDTNTKPATYSSDTPGSYDITVSALDSNGSYNPNPAKFTLVVTEDTTTPPPPPPSDTTGPEITYTLDPATPDGSNGWYKSNVAIDWTVTDDESEPTIDSGCEDQTITADTDSSGVTLSCEAHSDGGEAEPVSVTIKKDATAPTVSLAVGDNGIAADGSYFFGFVPSQPTCEASDTTPGSGLDGECTVAGYGDSVGEHTVKATANDNAGNTGESESITYTVKKWDLTGFYQPVDMGTTMNTVKGGSTVPFKFDISAATEFTSTTFNGNPIGTFSAKKVSCTPGGEDAIEQVVTATGNTALRYDTTSGQFVYNWQTPKGAGICYDTTFTDQSGATLTAHFKTK